MAGILDSKSRVLDLTLTPIGRKQLASGKLRIDAATVSDRSSFYERESSGGAEDATRRLYFETYSTPSDQITLESDDSGQLIPFIAGDTTIRGGVVYDSSGSPLQRTTAFASFGQEVAASSASNFAGLKVLLTDDPEDRETAEFALSGTDFDYVPVLPDSTRTSRAHIDSIESVLFDKRLSRKPNFMFLPPVNNNGDELGNYADARQQFEDSDYETPLSSLTSSSKGSKYQTFITQFDKTTASNRIALQVFETGEGTSMRKLDLIDFGDVKKGDETMRVIFAGRVFLNTYGFPTFVNLITLVLK